MQSLFKYAKQIFIKISLIFIFRQIHLPKYQSTNIQCGITQGSEACIRYTGTCIMPIAVAMRSQGQVCNRLFVGNAGSIPPGHGCKSDGGLCNGPSFVLKSPAECGVSKSGFSKFQQRCCLSPSRTVAPEGKVTGIMMLNISKLFKV